MNAKQLALVVLAAGVFSSGCAVAQRQGPDARGYNWIQVDGLATFRKHCPGSSMCCANHASKTIYFSEDAPCMVREETSPAALLSSAR